MFVYKHYNQESLDAQFNNRLHVPDYADYLNRWKLSSEQTSQRLTVIKDIPYGKLSREKLDIYPSVQPHSRTLLFIHGGYWQMLDKSMFHFIAEGFHAYGVTTVLLTYPLAPEASMDQMVLSCRNAMTWLYSNVSEYNGDAQQMYVAGHSAGGHLAAMLMATDWPLFHDGLPRNLLNGICAVSGLFNLVPIQLSYINNVLKLDMETAERYSPVRLEPSNACPLIIAVGEAETAAFKEQSNELFMCWKSKRITTQLLQLPAQNHFSIVDSVIDPQSSLHQALRHLMKIK